MVLATSPSPTVIWHDLECGGYRADLALWRRLAREAASRGRGAAVLDIGAGSGRVSLDLARAGHDVTALDREHDLLDALGERDARVQTVQADARDFELARRDFDIAVVPMQTIQLLAGARERQALLRQAREHLRPGGTLACAIVTEIEAFDYADGGWGPEPESARIDDVDYVSRAVRIRVLKRSFTIERERTVTRAGCKRERARNVVELARVTVASLHAEGERAGFSSAGTRRIEPTDEHVGSEVVVLRA